MIIVAYSFWEKPQIFKNVKEERVRDLVFDLKNLQYGVDILTEAEFEISDWNVDKIDVS